ncbi:elongation factor 1-delta-like isoform X1 [Haliotis cracherodii]|uniref:elongation factor 1-delta-like isoform X1 n=1 Tax=Haliotis cracherodii TaxID=6455 RepID=UPI0039E72F6D
MANPLMNESVWFHQQKFEQAEAHYQQILAGTATPGQRTRSVQQGKQGGSSLVNEIAQARQEISKLLKNPIAGGSVPPGKMDSLERENRELRKVTDELRAMVLKLENRVSALERGSGVPAASASAPAAATPSKPADDDDDDDDDMFGSDDEEEAAELEKLKAERVAAYKAKKASKPTLIAKSNLILEVKPWDDETDMKELEQKVRQVSTDGLKWGSSKLVPVGYGINKLQIMCVVEDDKVGTDFLEESITAYEDFVQSVDVVAFNKI